MNHAVPTPGLNDLSPTRRNQVLDAVSALETSDTPVSQFPALLDPGLRRCVEGCLDEAGRVLITSPRGGYTSGYADDVSDALVREEIGVLPAEERAVLALVLLYCVAAPRAQGRVHGQDWTEGEPLPVEQLKKRSQLPKGEVDGILRNLQQRRLIRRTRGGVLPGPQLARLSPAAARRLWDQLVLVAAPKSAMAQIVRGRLSRGLAEDGAAPPKVSLSRSAPGESTENESTRRDHT